MSRFLDDLRRRGLPAAAQRWTGYPEMASDAPAADRVPFIEQFLVDPVFARLLEADRETCVNASSGRTGVAPVVTVSAPRNGDVPPAAAAFIVGYTDEFGEPGVMWIRRLTETDAASVAKAAGS